MDDRRDCHICIRLFCRYKDGTCHRGRSRAQPRNARALVDRGCTDGPVFARHDVFHGGSFPRSAQALAGSHYASFTTPCRQDDRRTGPDHRRAFWRDIGVLGCDPRFCFVVQSCLPRCGCRYCTACIADPRESRLFFLYSICRYIFCSGFWRNRKQVFTRVFSALLYSGLLRATGFLGRPSSLVAEYSSRLVIVRIVVSADATQYPLAKKPARSRDRARAKFVVGSRQGPCASGSTTLPIRRAMR